MASLEPEISPNLVGAAAGVRVDRSRDVARVALAPLLLNVLRHLRFRIFCMVFCYFSRLFCSFEFRLHADTVPSPRPPWVPRLPGVAGSTVTLVP
jgi:hypothetical protein